MEPYLIITNLNDFIFCPRSIYFHNLYGGYSKKNYHESYQTQGNIAHQAIDEKKYSTKKKIITGLEVYSEKYCIGGKIDIYNGKTKTLIERKRQIKTIYDGYRYQLYAQYFCMIEMGYKIESLAFHSLVDNKKYKVEIPNKKRIKEFEDLLKKMHSFNMNDDFKANPNKCHHCIYNELCDHAEYE